MDDDKFRSELLMRKFEPVSDWKPAGKKSDITQTFKSIFADVEH